MVSALDMLTACEAALPADILIASAAVADYRPAHCSDSKLKKTDDNQQGMRLELVRNPDILATLAMHPSLRPGLCVGFAAETHDLLSYASDKLQRKNLDLIVANDVSQSDIGFNSDDNRVTLLSRQQAPQHLELASKASLARRIIRIIGEHIGRSA